MSVPDPAARRRKREAAEVTAETSVEVTNENVTAADVDQAVQASSDPDVESAGNAERKSIKAIF